MNHYLDVHTGALVYGAILGKFDPLVAVVSAENMRKVAKAKRRKYVYRHV
jgi:hypothetical protein